MGIFFPKQNVCVDNMFIPILALFGDIMWYPIIMCNFYVSFNKLIYMWKNGDEMHNYTNMSG